MSSRRRGQILDSRLQTHLHPDHIPVTLEAEETNSDIASNKANSAAALSRSASLENLPVINNDDSDMVRTTEEVARMLCSNTVAVLVGPSEVKYNVHKDILTSSSPFFAAMLNGPFKEATENLVKLPEEVPEVFGAVIAVMYRGVTKSIVNMTTYKLPVKQLPPPLGVRLYVALDMYGMRNATFEVMDYMRVVMKENKMYFSTDTIAYIYENTLDNCVLRKHASLLTAFKIFYDGGDENEYAGIIEAHPSFATDISASVKILARGGVEI